MFWKRRNIIALVLLAVAALAVPQGLSLLNGADETHQETQPAQTSAYGTSIPITAPTYSNTVWTDPFTEPSHGPTTAPVPPDPDRDSRSAQFFGAVMALGGALSGFWAVFLLTQKEPLLGPDAAGLLLSLCLAFLRSRAYPEALPLGLALLASRELWGWLRSRLPLTWCLCHRTAKLPRSTRWYPLVLCLWSVLLGGSLVYWLPRFAPGGYPILGGMALAELLALWVLLRWSRDLEHLHSQLHNLEQGKAVEIRSGLFEASETALSQLQEAHREAIQTAVTSERFKVELISNVSHDLRTPLTAILGYSELLQAEALSPEGRKQLERLNQKAGYMEALVESLFELTKVSSGVLEPKLEKIDLIRLLEQTLGLFDDQLTAASLQVRRHYAHSSLSLITDGARLHQVFANLLGNAIKYALPGTRIHLEIRETERSVLVRMVNIASYEMDFQPEEILQRFARGDKARSTKGSGLGLAIAQTYSESLGGSFRVAIDGDQFSAIVELPKN